MWSSNTIVTVKVLLKLELQNLTASFFTFLCNTTKPEGLATPPAQGKAGVGWIRQEQEGLGFSQSTEIWLCYHKELFLLDCLGGG